MMLMLEETNITNLYKTVTAFNIEADSSVRGTALYSNDIK
jgi:hypothetical protein